LKALLRAIMDRAKVATSLITTPFTGGFWVTDYPHGQTPAGPYVIISLLGGSDPLLGFQGAHKIERPAFRLTIFNKTPLSDSIMGYMDTLKTRFDEATLIFAEASAAGWTSHICRRMHSGLLLFDKETGYWSFTIDYEYSYQSI